MHGSPDNVDVLSVARIGILPVVAVLLVFDRPVITSGRLTSVSRSFETRAHPPRWGFHGSILRAMQKAARALGVLGALGFVASAFVISGLACMDVRPAVAAECAADSFLRFGATSLVGAGAAVIGVWFLPRRTFIAAASMLMAAGVGLVLLIAYGYFVSSLRVFWQVAAAGSSLAAALALASRVREEAAIAPERPAAKSPRRQ
jgi:hypothetical protein